MVTADYRCGKIVVAVLDKGNDLQQELERLVLAADIAFCHVSGIGSLDRVRMTYYDQDVKQDRDIVLDHPVMLAAMTGTAFARGDEVAVHAHIVLSEGSGTAYGGDLSLGCRVFSCQLVLTELLGPSVGRSQDAGTGLARLTFPDE